MNYGLRFAWMIGKQILRRATSVGANYRSSCRAKSTPDFFNKLEIVEEEADETIYWLEIIVESKLISPEKVHSLNLVLNEILAIHSSKFPAIPNSQLSIINYQSVILKLKNNSWGNLLPTLFFRFNKRLKSHYTGHYSKPSLLKKQSVIRNP